MSCSHLYLDLHLLVFHYSLSYIMHIYHDYLLDLHMMYYYSMLLSFHLVSNMFTSHFRLFHSSLCYMFIVFMLPYPTYSVHYNFLSLCSVQQNFMLHLYIISNMFMPHLLTSLISSLILMLINLSLLSLNLPLLALSFTNNMLLLLLNLYISMLLFDFMFSSCLYYLMSL